MSTAHDAAIVSIGACMFDPYLGPEQEITETYYTTVSLESNQMFDRQISASTVIWWLQQNDAARAALLTQNANLPAALQNFSSWFQHDTVHRPTHVWANDPDFDVAILRSAFQACKLYWPLQFWMHRSMRTVGELAYPVNDERKAVVKLLRHDTVHHNALDDAVTQARFIAQCYLALNLPRPTDA